MILSIEFCCAMNGFEVDILLEVLNLNSLIL